MTEILLPLSRRTLKKIIERCWAYQKADRPTMAEIVAELRKFDPDAKATAEVNSEPPPPSFVRQRAIASAIVDASPAPRVQEESEVAAWLKSIRLDQYVEIFAENVSLSECEERWWREGGLVRILFGRSSH